MKRFNWKSFDFGPELEIDSKLGIKYEKSNINEPSSNIEMIESLNFYDKITPKTVDDLAVHSKKIEDVQKWLILNVLNQETKNPFLLLSGPSGSAKATTLNVLCKKLSISMLEWVNPTNQDCELFRTNQMKRFMEFLIDSKWHSLFEIENTRKITLVKDFPNAVIYQPEEFFNILNECYKLKFPIVFICTDATGNSMNLMRTLFTEDIINKYNIAHISFNTCSSMLMKKAMKRAQLILQENFNYIQPLPSTIDAILATAVGDIRNAMNQFYMECLSDSDVLLAKDLGNNNKKKKQNGTPSFRNMSKDEKLGLFHGLGRILNPKRKQVNNSWRLNCDIEQLVNEFSTQPTLFTTFLFENYLKYFGRIDDVCHAAEILSTSLNFLNNWTDKQDSSVFGLWISILGLMVHNEHKVSKWNQIRGPTRISHFNSITPIRLEPMDNYYYDIIKNTSTCHKFKNVI